MVSLDVIKHHVYLLTYTPIPLLISIVSSQVAKKYLQGEYQDCLMDHCINVDRPVDFIKKEVTCPTMEDVVNNIAKNMGRTVSTLWRSIVGCRK